MQEKIITLATPVFFLLIFIELVVGLVRGRNAYRVNDAINSISLGVISQISGAFLRIVRIGAYAWLLQNFAVFTLPADSLWVWVTGLLLYDFCYYWLHRMGHEVNVLWAAHVVHHQSEEYNLSTALRQSGTGLLFGWIFYIPMALLGYPLEVFIAVGLIDLLYQFWVHTEQVGKLGWFDRVFVSPSIHRVHHAVNDIYIDKNYGGILLAWDHLFGTYREECDTEPVVYGTRAPLRSWNPLWANLEVYHALALDAWRAQHWADKLRVAFARPGWRPADVSARWPAPDFNIARPRFHPPSSRLERAYCLAQFTLVLLVATHFLSHHMHMTLLHSGAYALWLLAGLTSIGGLLERRYHALEALRICATGIAVVAGGYWFGGIAMPAAWQAAALLICLLSLAGLWVIKKRESKAYGHLSSQ